jgi:hypothetical protein
MQYTLKTLKALTIISVSLAATLPLAAQLNSRSAQITIIARMPETLGLSLNNSGLATTSLAMNGAGGLGFTTGVTTSWNLEEGRSQVATWAYIDRKSAPVQLALASGIGVNPFRGPSADYHGIVLPSTISVIKLDAAPITSSDRRSAKTVDFSETEQMGQRQPLSDEDGRGTIKIQVQAVL